MAQKRIIPKKIGIPHIGYTLYVKQFKKHPDVPAAKAYTERNDANSSTLFMDMKKKLGGGDVGHELIHVLQFICSDRSISFLEQEHMAYLFQYLWGRIMGYEYDI